MHLYRSISQAAENGYLDIVKYLHKNKEDRCETYSIEEAAKNDHLDIVKIKKI